jgi:phosphate acetyltransferase
MGFDATMIEKAKAVQKRLVLAEGYEPRTIKAARKILDQKIAASVTLVGIKAEVEAEAKKQGVDLTGLILVDPTTDVNRDKYVKIYFDAGVAKDNKKKAAGKEVKKPMTEDLAKKDMNDCLRYGAMIVKQGAADAMVAGADSATADVIRAGLGVIGTAPGSKTASSCFVMQLKEQGAFATDTFIFADCAVNIEPTSEQLADIAQAAAGACRTFLGKEPVEALLSFSSKGSAKHEVVTKVQNAVQMLHDRKVDFMFDGELQLDAALVPVVTDKKAPGSPIKGKVNTLVFPGLASGNIGYKLVQRFAGAQAFGPYLLGFARPISDLSRGCSVDDIVVTSAAMLALAK